MEEDDGRTYNLRDKPHRRLLCPEEQEYWDEMERQYRHTHELGNAKEEKRPRSGIKASEIEEILSDLKIGEPNFEANYQNIRAAWDARPKSWRNFSPSYQAEQTKWTVFWALPPDKRHNLLVRCGTVAIWRPGTMVTRMGMLLKVGKILEDGCNSVKVLNCDKQFMLNLEHIHNTTPPGHPIIITPPEIMKMCAKMDNMGTTAATSASVALRLAYSTLQRLPDVLQIQARYVTPHTRATTAVTLTKGKMTRCHGAHTVHVGGKLAGEVLEVKRVALSDSLFHAKAKAIIQSVMPDGRTMKASRKGATIACCINGVGDAELNAQLLHPQMKTTKKYTHHGKYSATALNRGLQLQQSVGLEEMRRRFPWLEDPPSQN